MGDAIVIIILSHSCRNGVYSVDGKLLNFYTSILTPFNNENCPKLQSKPKMFFIGGCRDSKY